MRHMTDEQIAKIYAMADAGKMNVMVFGQGVALSAKKAREMGEKLTRIADTMDELQRLTAGLEA